MDNKNKLPRTLHGQQCITPCFKSNTKILHPITLEYITNIHSPFCAVGEWMYTDPITKKKNLYVSDACYKESKYENVKDLNIAIANVPFNANVFLKEHYDINTIEEAIDYVENRKLAIHTEERIIEAAWKAFHMEDDELIDDRIIDYFIHKIKKNWINYLYGKFGKFIVIEKDKIRFGHSVDNKHSIEKMNFITGRLISRNTIDTIIRKINKSGNYDFLLLRVKREITLYLQKKINTTIN